MAGIAVQSIRGVKIAVMGCCHGALNSIYATLNEAHKVHNQAVELLIVGGDFQAVRNDRDLNAMSVPEKYRHMGDYWEYYNGTKRAPIPTIVVGGNHEASSHMWELYYGGWLCPNIYYLGVAGVVNFRGLRIGGMSGIYNRRSYQKAHYERLPYDRDDIKSAYHTRAFDVLKLFKASGNIDVFMSHDWPQAIEYHGDVQGLFKEKPWFRKDSETGELGNPAGKSLLYKLKPRYWFASHMHCEFAAVVNHNTVGSASGGGGGSADVSGTTGPTAGNPDELDLDMENEVGTKNEDEIDLDLESGDEKNEGGVKIDTNTKPQSSDPPSEPTKVKEDEKVTEQQGTSQYPKPPPKNTSTQFLALDKVLPGRDWLKILDITPAEAPSVDQGEGFHYDPEWLAITRVFNSVMPNSRESTDAYRKLEKDDKKLQELISKELAWVQENIVKPGKLQIPEDFETTAPPQTTSAWRSKEQPEAYDNPHTVKFCELLNITNMATKT